MDSPLQGPVMRKAFPCYYYIMVKWVAEGSFHQLIQVRDVYALHVAPGQFWYELSAGRAAVLRWVGYPGVNQHWTYVPIHST